MGTVKQPSPKLKKEKPTFKSLHSIDDVLSSMKANVPSVIEVGSRLSQQDRLDLPKDIDGKSIAPMDEESLLRKIGPKVTTNFESFEAVCPKCKERVSTQVSIFYSDAAYLICAIFFFLCLWPFCWIPFCLGQKRYKFLRDCEHRCPDPDCYTLIAHQRRG